MIKNSRQRNEESGAALIIVVFYITAIINTLAMMLLFTTATKAKIAYRELNAEKALFAAEAGIECAVAHLMEVGDLDEATEISGAVGDGTFAVTITPDN